MPDYSKGKIYTIRCRYDDTLIYVGSTILTLSKRIAEHRFSSKSDACMNKPLYQEVNKTNWNNWYIELYQDYPCDNKEQLNRREGEVIREIGTLNKIIAGRTVKEYRQDNADKIKEYGREYYRENVEKIKEYNKQYRENYADKIKEYRQNNANKMKEYNKQYHENNASKLNEYLSEKITCQCGAVIARSGKARHERTKKHINYINSLN